MLSAYTGTSDGGMVAQVYVQKYPGETGGLVLISTGGLDANTIKSLKRQYFFAPLALWYLKHCSYEKLKPKLIRLGMSHLRGEGPEEAAYAQDMFETIFRGYRQEKDDYFSKKNAAGPHPPDARATHRLCLRRPSDHGPAGRKIHRNDPGVPALTGGVTQTGGNGSDRYHLPRRRFGGAGSGRAERRLCAGGRKRRDPLLFVAGRRERHADAARDGVLYGASHAEGPAGAQFLRQRPL